MQLTLNSPNERKTEYLAMHLANALSAPLIIGFSGEIGAGKTTFIRAMLRSMGIEGAIKSPTYALVESYFTKDLQIHHFDLYRIQEDTELEYIGFRDYFTTQAICFIEWPERTDVSSSAVDLQLTLSTQNTARKIQMHARTSAGYNVLTLFSGAL